MTALRISFVGPAIISLAACPSPARQVVDDPEAALDVDRRACAAQFKSSVDLTHAVMAKNDDYRTMTAVHVVRVSAEVAAGRGAGNAAPQKLSGLLAIRRPSTYRLRVMGPLSMELADVLSLQGRDVIIPSRVIRKAERLRPVLSSLGDDIRAIYRLAASAEPKNTSIRHFCGHARALKREVYVIERMHAKRCIARLLVDQSSLAILRSEVAIEAPAGNRGAPTRRVVEYDDLRQQGNVIVPHRIRVTVSGPLSYRLNIDVESVSLNSALDPALFTL